MDLSEFQPAPAPWRRCLSGHLIAELSDEQQKTIAEAIKSNSITASRIAEVLTKWSGVPIPASGMRRHRRGECTCA